MKITSEMLQALASIKGATPYIGEDAARAAKKAWWVKVREAYDLDPDTKYKVATTGEDAGELRFKHTGEPVPDRPLGKFVIIDKQDITDRFATADDARNSAEFDADDTVVVEIVS